MASPPALPHREGAGEPKGICKKTNHKTIIICNHYQKNFSLEAVHVDVWNQADPQKIINLIPDDIKPYVILNLSLSCGYDTKLNIHQRPQNAIRTYKSWATICQQNKMWFTLQPASGGHTHIHENDLETFEYFFKKFPNFLGWNYAEQFWGFDAPGDLFSSSQAARIALLLSVSAETCGHIRSTQ